MTPECKMETPGPYQARTAPGGAPADPCPYGVVSLTEGREVCRVWREQDAKAIAAMLSAAAPEAPAPVANEAMIDAAMRAYYNKRTWECGRLTGCSQELADQPRADMVRAVSAAIAVSSRPTHRHKKRGSLYRVVGEATAQVSRGHAYSNPETDDAWVERPLRDGSRLTVYQAEDGTLWARFHDEFEDGRFEEMAANKPPARPIALNLHDAHAIEKGAASEARAPTELASAGKWDGNYRPLKAGEIIEAGDEVLTDSHLGWRPDTRCVGQPAPDPSYTSHRMYRRPIASTTPVVRVKPATLEASSTSCAPIDGERVARAMEDGKGFWRGCSGCHELNEGHPTGLYSKALKCHVGLGCHECGGIGAVWDTTDYEDMAHWMANETPAPSDAVPAAARAEGEAPGYVKGVKAALQAMRKCDMDLVVAPGVPDGAAMAQRQLEAAVSSLLKEEGR